jgi:hypothetical protein
LFFTAAASTAAGRRLRRGRGALLLLAASVKKIGLSKFEFFLFYFYIRNFLVLDLDLCNS